jgi:uncharacterized glyoxalase superfamily protein PhnB
MTQTNIAAPEIIPWLRYNDAPKAIDWLVGAFGPERHMVVPNDDGTIAHAQLSFGSGMIMLGSAREDDLGVRSAAGLPAHNMGIYAIIDDVDSHYERAKAAGAQIVRAPVDEDYGGRGYTARDLEGNIWSFGSYRP